MASRVVRPETKKLNLSDGDWLLVKKRLNHGEQQAAFARRYVSDVLGNRVNLKLVGMETVTAYLLDWSLTDLDDQVIPIRGRPLEDVEAALNSFDPTTFAEIRDAIEAHEKAVALALAEQKKTIPAGESESSPTSLLPAPVAGPSTSSDPSTLTTTT